MKISNMHVLGSFKNFRRIVFYAFFFFICITMVRITINKIIDLDRNHEFFIAFGQLYEKNGGRVKFILIL